MLKALQEVVNPAELNLKIDSAKALKTAVVVKCADEVSRESLMDHLQKSLGSNFSIEKAKKWNPRLLIKGVELDLFDKSNEYIVGLIIKLNNFDETFANNVRVVTKIKYSSGFNLVLEVSNDIRKIMLNKDKLFVGWKSCWCVDYIYVRRCYQCSKFGHTSNDCKNNPTCGKCSETHDTKSCTVTSYKCINCMDYNERRGCAVSVEHMAGDVNKCMAYNKEVEFLKTKIQY